MILELLTTALMALFSYCYLFLIAKIMGHRQIAQLDAFDYITGITVGSLAADLAIELEEPMKMVIALAVYGLLTLLLSHVTMRFPRCRKIVEGTPTILYHNGKLYKKNLKKAKLDLSEFQALCRQQGYFDLGQIYSVVYEHSGSLSILPVEQERPVTPKDLNLEPQQTTFFTEVIMDGRVLTENLQRLGKEEKWLEKQLAEQGFKSPKEIFLGLCDQNDKLTCYPTSDQNK